VTVFTETRAAPGHRDPDSRVDRIASTSRTARRRPAAAASSGPRCGGPWTRWTAAGCCHVRPHLAGQGPGDGYRGAGADQQRAPRRPVPDRRSTHPEIARQYARTTAPASRRRPASQGSTTRGVPRHLPHRRRDRRGPGPHRGVLHALPVARADLVRRAHIRAGRRVAPWSPRGISTPRDMLASGAGITVPPEDRQPTPKPCTRCSATTGSCARPARPPTPWGQTCTGHRSRAGTAAHPRRDDSPAAPRRPRRYPDVSAGCVRNWTSRRRR